MVMIEQKVVYFSLSVICFCFFSSLSSTHDELKIPEDLNKETILLPKKNFIYMAQMDYSNDPLVKKEINDEYESAIQLLQKSYPFKYICTETDSTFGAKYEFDYVADGESVDHRHAWYKQYNLQIKEIHTGAMYKIIKHSDAYSYAAKELRLVINAIKKKYGK